MEILQQLGELALAATPTVVIVLLFYFFLRWSFFGPLMRVLDERQSLSEGARRDAESLRVAAEEKRRARQEGLRKERARIFAEQEAARRTLLNERSTAIQEARSRANEEIQAARDRIAADVQAGRGELEASGEQFANEILRAVLKRTRPKLSPLGGVQ